MSEELLRHTLQLDDLNEVTDIDKRRRKKKRKEVKNEGDESAVRLPEKELPVLMRLSHHHDTRSMTNSDKWTFKKQKNSKTSEDNTKKNLRYFDREGKKLLPAELVNVLLSKAEGRGGKKRKQSRKEESVFTEEDFNKFEKEYHVRHKIK